MKKKYILFIVCLVFLSIPFLVYFNLPPAPISVVDFSYDAWFNEKGRGFDTGVDKIHFGVLPISGGQMSERYINITNGYDFFVTVVGMVEGPFKNHISLSDNDFLLGPNESYQVTLYLTSEDGDFEEGYYEGTMRFKYYKDEE